MLQETPLFLDTPCLIHGARNGAEHAERRPHEAETARHSDPDTGIPEGHELCVDEIELCREIAEHECEHRQAVLRIGGHPPQDRKDKQQKGKQREQRVIRNRRGMRQIIAIEQPNERSPRGQA